MENKKKKGMSAKLCATLLALAVVLGLGIGSTIAWLTAQTDPVVNTFTVGDIEILLFEHEYNQETNKLNTSKNTTSNTYKIVPGQDLPKDPKLAVMAGSEPCWLFLKVTEENFIAGLDYEIDTKRTENAPYGGTYITGYWTPVPGEDDVYYLEFTPQTYDVFFVDDTVFFDTGLPILRDDTVTVSGEITKEQLEAIDGDVELNFTAYAIQHEGFPTVEAAWKVIKDTYLSDTSATAE